MSYTYMKNSILNYSTVTQTGASSTNFNGIDYKCKDYTSFDYSIIYKKVRDLACNPQFFEWYQCANNDKIERISYELYGTTDYWDILLLINGYDPLFDMPYVFDVVDSLATAKVTQYMIDNPLAPMPLSQQTYLHEKFQNILMNKNEVNRTIKIVKPSQIQEFFRTGRELGCFK